MYICVFNDYKALDFTPFLAKDEDEAIKIALSDEYMNEGSYENYPSSVTFRSDGYMEIFINDEFGGCTIHCYEVKYED